MAGGSAIRGSRVGAGPMGEAERGEAAPRIYVSFWCANEHESRPSFATDAEVPEEWDCARCGLPAGPDKENPPAPPKIEPYKTHLAYVKERRSDKDGAAILQEALDRLQCGTVAERRHRHGIAVRRLLLLPPPGRFRSAHAKRNQWLSRNWDLEIGASLDIGFWCLVI